MNKTQKAKELFRKLEELKEQGKEDTEEFYELDEKLYKLIN